MGVAGPAMDMIAREFVDAFNRRDAEDLIALVSSALDWRPSRVVGGERIYRGHDGVRQWVLDLADAPVQHQARVREVETLDEYRFLIHSEVLVAGEPVSPASMLARLDEDGRIVEARGYLTDEPMLRRAAIVRSGARSPAQELRRDRP